MANLDDLIRFEREHTNLDFKKTQYTRPQHEALLKDVLALANAHTTGERHILCGVDLLPDNRRIIVGVPPESVVDSATYQQLVRTNIEPDIPLEYFAHEIDGVVVGVIRIANCPERPYCMRKDRGSLLRGHMWIRKGTEQMFVARDDLERIYSERIRAADFAGAIRIGFDAPGEPDTIPLSRETEVTLPSDRVARRIREIIAQRAKAPSNSTVISLMPLPGVQSIVGSTALELRSTPQLEDNLTTVRRDYQNEDEYELYELHSHKVNLILRNDQTVHLEDARLDIEIAPVPGVLIAERDYAKPDHSRYALNRGSNHPLHFRGDPDYPKVNVEANGTRVVQDLGDLRHQTRTPAFEMPLRFVLLPESADQTVTLKCTIRGKNLPRPAVSSLTIVVADPASPQTTSGHG